MAKNFWRANKQLSFKDKIVILKKNSRIINTSQWNKCNQKANYNLT